MSETTTTSTTKGKTTTTTVKSVDVLTDVLGSAVATASGGVISADLALYGDFGDPLTTPKTDTVTGFTGKIDTAGLVEFAARTYDPATRQWVQDDRYRGTVTRAASMNRYAYVEGAPESFVDELGFYRARAAIRAQKLAAAQAAYDAAVAAYDRAVQIAYKEAVSYEQTCGKYGCVKADIEVRGQYGFVNTADAVYGQYGYTSAWSIAAQKKLEIEEEKARVRAREQAKIDAYNKSQDKGYLGGFVDTLSIVGNSAVGTVTTGAKLGWDVTKAVVSTAWEIDKAVASAAWNTTKAVVSTAWAIDKAVASAAWNTTKAVVSTTWAIDKAVASAAWDVTTAAWDTAGRRVTETADFSGELGIIRQTRYRDYGNPDTANLLDTTLTYSAEYAAGTSAIVYGGGRVYDEGPFCGATMVCIVDADIVLTGNAHTITRGHVVISTRDSIDAETQAEEYQHSIDQVDVGITEFDFLYLGEGWAATTDGEGFYDGNSYETWAKGQAATWKRTGGDPTIFMPFNEWLNSYPTNSAG